MLLLFPSVTWTNWYMIFPFLKKTMQKADEENHWCVWWRYLLARLRIGYCLSHFLNSLQSGRLLCLGIQFVRKALIFVHGVDQRKVEVKNAKRKWSCTMYMIRRRSTTAVRASRSSAFFLVSILSTHFLFGRSPPAALVPLPERQP